MTLREALFYFKTKKELAESLNITKQAVSGWKLDSPIPEARSLKLQHEIIPRMTGKPYLLKNDESLAA